MVRGSRDISRLIVAWNLGNDVSTDESAGGGCHVEATYSPGMYRIVLSLGSFPDLRFIKSCKRTLGLNRRRRESRSWSNWVCGGGDSMQNLRPSPSVLALPEGRFVVVAQRLWKAIFRGLQK